MKARASALIPFVPSGPEFHAALAFFADLGFETAWQHDGLAGLRFGGANFILQDIHIPVWQENQMHVVEVDDLDLYWSEIEALDLPSKYPGVRTKPPTGYPWGREVHIIDPAGVCWHFRKGQ
jgi:hypothetical protein